MSSMYSNSFQDSSLTPMASEDHDSMTDDDNDDETVIEIEKVVGSSSVPSEDAILGEEDPQKNAYGKKERRKRSIIHEETTIINLPGGEVVRKCNWCTSTFICDRQSFSTSAPKRHLLLHCVARKIAKIGNVKGKKVTQKILGSSMSKDSEESSEVTWVYDHSKVRELAAHMVLGHEYSFRMLEHVIFNKFMKAVYPWYQKISRKTVRNDCECFYKGEKFNMKAMMSKVRRIGLTIDLWWSGEQKIGYMTVTGHFIDAKWVLHKRVLDFVNVPPPHTGKVLARQLIKVMDDWGIKDRVVSITVDNTSANDNCIKRLKEDISSKRKLLLDGKLFHVRCCAHILNLLVKDGLQVITESIEKIRGGVKHLVSSERRCNDFNRIRLAQGLSGKLQVLDNNTRWNSTWLMLSIACFYKTVWPRYAEEDSTFLNFLLTDIEWERVEDICRFLEVFADATKVISGSYYPTVNLFLAQLWKIKCLLNDHIELSTKRHLSVMAMEMQLKFDKYWRECDILISLGAILDPRFKMAFVGWTFPDIYGESDKTNLDILHSSVRLIFMEYEKAYKKPTEIPQQESTSSDSRMISRFGKEKKSLTSFLNSVQQLDNQKSELDLYLEEGVAPGGKDKNFCVLQWWRANEAKYPVLSKMAKDILTIPVTTVASEATFSAGKRVIDAKRASMSVTTVAILLCGGDWVKELHGLKRMKSPDDEKFWELECDFSKLSLEAPVPAHALAAP